MTGSATAALAAELRADWAWQRRRAARHLAAMASPEAVAALARAALTSPDDGVTAIARRAVAAVTDQAGIDAACAVWADTGDRWLGQLIIEAGWLASRPAGLRVSTALHAGRGEALADGDANVAQALLAAAGAQDPTVQARAEEALRGLRRAEARELVCARALEQGDPVAVDAALAGGFLSEDPVRQALLLFLAGEFDRYAELDFDGSLLAGAHAAASAKLRARLAQQARAGGRLEWVRAIAGRHTDRLGALSEGEWEASIAMLAAAGQYEQLWRLALQAPPLWGVRMLAELNTHDYRPAGVAERTGYAELVALAGRAVPLPTASLWTAPSWTSTELPHTSDVSSVVCSPDGALLASGSSDATVRLWRLSSDEPMGILTGHTSRVVSVAVSPDGALLASGSSDATVRLWRLPSGEPVHTLTLHPGYVKSVAVSPDGLVASHGSDGTVRLWSLSLSGLVTMCRTPVEQISLSEIERLRSRIATPPEALTWIELLTALVRWRHRHDIEVDAAATAAQPGATDVELDSG